MNRRVLVVLLALSLALPLLTGFTPSIAPITVSQDDRLIQMSVSPGYEGRFRSGRWLPVLINVSNDGPDVRGVLRVHPLTTEGLDAAVYSTPIDLPGQSRKQVFLYVALQPVTREIVVELVAGDTVIEAVAAQVAAARVSDMIAATVTDSPSGTVDFSSVRLGGNNTYQATWSVENVPPLADALLGVNVMAFSDVDSSRLTVEQQMALHDWVLAGGHLIVTGGPNYRPTGAGLAGLLPLDLTGTTTVDDLTALARFAGRYEETLAADDIVLAAGDLRPGAEVLVAIDDTPLLVRRTLGEGVVDFLAVDPNQAPLRDWVGIGALWEVLVTAPYQQPSWSNGFQQWDQAELVVQQAPGFALPDAAQMCGLLAFYIIVIGPGNYFVLRLIGKRELAWITIPVLVVAFSIMAFVTGSSLRGTQATINRLSLVQVWPEADRAQVDGLIGILSPRRANYTLSAPEGFTLRPISQPPNVGGGGIAAAAANTRFEQGAAHSAREFLVDASIVAGFATSGFLDDAPQLEADLTLTYGEQGTGSLSGRITNSAGFTLNDAVLLYRTGAYGLGTLAPGDEADFEAAVTSTAQSAPLARSWGYDSVFTSGFFGGASSGSINVTVRDVLGAQAGGADPRLLFLTPTPPFAPTPRPRATPVPTPLPRSESLDERAFRQQLNFLSAIAADRDLSGGRGDSVYLAGWVEGSPLDLTLEGAGWTPEDVTVYLFELPLTVERPAGQEALITPSFSTWFITSASTALNVTQPYNFAVNGGERAAFRFTPLPSAQLAEVSSITITATIQNAPAADALLSLWNWRDAEWETLDTAPNLQEVTITGDVARFIGPANAVEVMVEPVTVAGFIAYQALDVIWRGRF